jgi:hypothetical protein
MKKAEPFLIRLSRKGSIPERRRSIVTGSGRGDDASTLQEEKVG